MLDHGKGRDRAGASRSERGLRTAVTASTSTVLQDHVYVSGWSALAPRVSLRTVARHDPRSVSRVDGFLEVGANHSRDGVSSVEQAHSAISGAPPLALTARDAKNELSWRQPRPELKLKGAARRDACARWPEARPSYLSIRSRQRRYGD